MLLFAVLGSDCAEYDVVLGCRGSRYLWKRRRITATRPAIDEPFGVRTKTSGE
ncbi:hypothetical protein Csa_000488, partial [Cucumis sativus]